MSQITSIEPFTDGDYQVTVIIGTGTAKLQLSTKDHDPEDIPNTSVLSSTIFTISIGDGNITPVLTGDAQVFIIPKRSV